MMRTAYQYQRINTTFLILQSFGYTINLVIKENSKFYRLEVHIGFPLFQLQWIFMSLLLTDMYFYCGSDRVVIIIFENFVRKISSYKTDTLIVQAFLNSRFQFFKRTTGLIYDANKYFLIIYLSVYMKQPPCVYV